VGLQMTIPFTVSQNGAISTETDNDIQIAQRVRAIIGTEVGQRPMRAAMGLPLSRLLFGVANTLITAELRDMIAQQLNSYEPGLQIQNVTPVVDKSNDGIADIRVDYTPILHASSVRAVADTVIIKVGGTVENVSLNGNT
jgi:phage baseplate assembly protein W